MSNSLEEAIQKIKWPLDSNSFGLRPKRKGNGVSIIKPDKSCLIKHRWELEKNIVPCLGPADALYENNGVRFAIEWETGNIASSYRSMTKLCHAFLKGLIIGLFV